MSGLKTHIHTYSAYLIALSQRVLRVYWKFNMDTTLKLRLHAAAVVSSSRGRAKELLPPDVRFQGFRHENESFIILFYMV